MSLRRSLSLGPALALLLLLAPAAQAAYEPIGSGLTKLKLDRGFVRLLGQNGVRLAGGGPVEVNGRTVSIPVAGGKFDPTAAKGTVTHAGALRFEAGSRSVPLRALMLKTTQRGAPFSAKVGGGQLKLASAKRLTVDREGFGSEVGVSALRLSDKLAGRLGKKLRLRDVFVAGQPLGSTVTRADPVTVAIKGGGSAGLVLDPGFEAKLRSLFVAVTPIFPAERAGVAFQSADLRRRACPRRVLWPPGNQRQPRTAAARRRPGLLAGAVAGTRRRRGQRRLERPALAALSRQTGTPSPVRSRRLDRGGLRGSQGQDHRPQRRRARSRRLGGSLPQRSLRQGQGRLSAG